MPAVNRDDPLVPEVEVNINGSPLSVDAAAHLMAVTVDNDVDLPDMFMLDFVGADDQEQQARREQPGTEPVCLSVVGDSHPEIAQKIAHWRVASGQPIERISTRIAHDSAKPEHEGKQD